MGCREAARVEMGPGRIVTGRKWLGASEETWLAAVGFGVDAW
jgi:hypothetical protein